MRTRAYPWPRISSQSVSYWSPTSIDSGAMRYNRVPSGWSMTLPITSSADCVPMGTLQSGQ